MVEERWARPRPSQKGINALRRPKDGSPAIRLVEADDSISTIAPTAYVKWLGVYFDRKLSFNYHVDTTAARAENAVKALTMLANTVRGLSHIHMRHLYRACIGWWSGKKTHAKSLGKTQNRALRLICAAFKTTPIHALEIEASIPPIHLTLDLEKTRAAIHFNKLSTRNPVWASHTNATERLVQWSGPLDQAADRLGPKTTSQEGATAPTSGKTHQQ